MELAVLIDLVKIQPLISALRDCFGTEMDKERGSGHFVLTKMIALFCVSKDDVGSFVPLDRFNTYLKQRGQLEGALKEWVDWYDMHNTELARSKARLVDLLNALKCTRCLPIFIKHGVYMAELTSMASGDQAKMVSDLQAFGLKLGPALKIAHTVHAQVE